MVNKSKKLKIFFAKCFLEAVNIFEQFFMRCFESRQQTVEIRKNQAHQHTRNSLTKQLDILSFQFSIFFLQLWICKFRSFLPRTYVYTPIFVTEQIPSKNKLFSLIKLISILKFSNMKFSISNMKLQYPILKASLSPLPSL